MPPYYHYYFDQMVDYVDLSPFPPPPPPNFVLLDSCICLNNDCSFDLPYLFISY